MSNFYGQYIGFGSGGGVAGRTDAVWYGTRGIYVGGYAYPSAPTSDTMQYITIASIGNASDFADLSVGRRDAVSLSDGTIGVSGGGTNAVDGSSITDVMDYVTIATIGGTADDFGNLTTTRSAMNGSISDIAGTGLFPGGGVSGGYSAAIDYITINTPGDANDWGDQTVSGANGASVQDGTYGLIAGVGATPLSDLIEIVTVATLGSAADWGYNILTANYHMGAASSDAGRGVWFGQGAPEVTVIQYVTIASGANALTFGDMNNNSRAGSGVSNGPRGVLSRGSWPPSIDLDYITFASTGNATDFGDLTLGTRGAGGMSGS
jgi:hypothetical protein